MYLKIHQKILSGYDLSCTWQDLIEEMGHTALETARQFVIKKNIPDTPESYRDKVAEMQKCLFPSTELMRGGVHFCASFSFNIQFILIHF